MKPKAVVLLSGGIDSATSAALAIEAGFELAALTFDYGQRHLVELEAAQHVAASLGISRHVVQQIDLRSIGGSALTTNIAVPKSQTLSTLGNDIPITYVPARNTIFLAHALALAEVAQALDIYIGVNAVDYSGYPDCRPAFIEAFERMANLATKIGVEGAHIHIHAPLINMTKAGIIREGIRLGVDYTLTHSCYDPTTIGLACGQCESCLIRQQGFVEAKVADVTQYASQ